MGLSPSGLMRVVIARVLPPRNDDSQNTDIAQRGGPFGDLKVESAFPTKHLLADEGVYYTATMLPGATALQLGLSAGFSAPACAIAIQNGSQRGQAKTRRVFLDYIKMLVNVAPTSGTSLRYATVVDDKDRTPTTISSGAGGTGPGVAATATAYKSSIFGVNMDDNTPSISNVYFPLSTAAGAPPAVPGAGPNARTLVGNGHLRGQIPVVQDEYVITVGNVDPTSGLVTAAPAGASRVVEHHPPIVLGPQQWCLFYLWAPGNITAGLAVDDLTVGLIER